MLALLIAAYAVSPIDLIPDFIPVLGYLDDLILVPPGLALVIRLTSSSVLETAREKALSQTSRPVSYAAATFILVLWMFLGWLVLR